jgi:hypothetical protein
LHTTQLKIIEIFFTKKKLHVIEFWVEVKTKKSMQQVHESYPFILAFWV